MRQHAQRPVKLGLRFLRYVCGGQSAEQRRISKYFAPFPKEGGELKTTLFIVVVVVDNDDDDNDDYDDN